MTETVPNLLLQVEQLIINREYDEALDLIAKISKRERLSDEEKLTCTLLESRIYFRKNELEKALMKVEKIWSTVLKQENPLPILDCINIKAGAAWIRSKIDDGIEIIEENLDLIANLEKKVQKKEERDFKTRKSTFLRNGGVLYWYKGEIDTSLDYHKRSLALAEEIDKKNLVLDSFNNIGLVYWSKGDFDIAIEHYNHALRLSEELELKNKTAIILTNIGNVYSLKGDLDKALEILLQGLEIRKKMQNKRDLAVSAINIGVVYQLKGDLDQSLDYYNQGLQLSKEIDDKSNIALALNNIGSILVLRGDIDTAIEYFQQSLKLYRELGIKEKIALLLANIGSYHQQKGNSEKAIDNYNQSLIIYEQIGNNVSTVVVLFELVQEAIEQRNHNLVQEYLEKMQQINKAENIRPIDQRYRLAKALSLKTSDQSRNQSKAMVMFKQIIEEEIVNHSSTVKAMVHLCDMLIRELKETADIELLKEIKVLLKKLKQIAEEQSSYSILAEIYRLEALLALAELDLKEARILLQKGLSFAEEKGLVNIASNIRVEQNGLNEQINLWEDLEERKAPLEETLLHVKIEESMKQLQHEETITSSKLFSLKL